jgi:glycine/D-amino acid oxidase-like deaminating enzyme
MTPMADVAIIRGGIIGNAMLWAPITGELITALVCKKKLKMDAAPFSPARFTV